jgi:hypothetical protein
VSSFTTAKALRLLIGGRAIVACGQRGIEARVRGDHDTYRLFLEPQGWRCTCPSWKRCSHVEAVERVAPA